MLVMDLDGTLIGKEQRLGVRNHTALTALHRRRVVRVVATGRSLFAARRVIDERFPIDYLVFSSGAGTVKWPEDELISSHKLATPDVLRVANLFEQLRLDFMLQGEVPHTHRFHYHRGQLWPNPDFDRRVARYADHASPLKDKGRRALKGSHFVAIEPPGVSSVYDRLKRELAPLHVVRTTSPLDHESRWIEVYPAGVGKSFAAEQLRMDLGVAMDQVFAVGNDFNDEDLLSWASHAFVVSNAHQELRQRYCVVSSNEAGGVSEVAKMLLAGLT